MFSLFIFFSVKEFILFLYCSTLLWSFIYNITHMCYRCDILSTSLHKWQQENKCSGLSKVKTLTVEMFVHIVLFWICNDKKYLIFLTRCALTFTIVRLFGTMKPNVYMLFFCIENQRIHIVPNCDLWYFVHIWLSCNVQHAVSMLEIEKCITEIACIH